MLFSWDEIVDFIFILFLASILFFIKVTYFLAPYFRRYFEIFEGTSVLYTLYKDRMSYIFSTAPEIIQFSSFSFYFLLN